MKKNKTKIERIVYEDSWVPEANVEWDTFKRLAEERIKFSVQNGYSNPRVRIKGDWDSQELEIVLSKFEDEEAFNKRKAAAEEKLAKERVLKIEKLKKEAKELGLEIK